MDRRATYLAIACAVAGIAIGYLGRPVVVRKIETSAEDSLRREVRLWSEIARQYEAQADEHRRILDSLQRHPLVITKRIRHHERTLHFAGLDAIRDSILVCPE